MLIDQFLNTLVVVGCKPVETSSNNDWSCLTCGKSGLEFTHSIEVFQTVAVLFSSTKRVVYF